MIVASFTAVMRAASIPGQITKSGNLKFRIFGTLPTPQPMQVYAGIPRRLGVGKVHSRDFHLIEVQNTGHRANPFEDQGEFRCRELNLTIMRFM